jgi:hypothetical protein
VKVDGQREKIAIDLAFRRAGVPSGEERPGTNVPFRCCQRDSKTEETMGRYALLWLLGVPIPILLLIWAFGGLH